MKKLFFLILLLCSNMVFAKSTLVFDNPIHKFGNIPMDSKVTHVFTFTNRGKSLLKIDRVRAGCSCTGTLLTKRKINPGEKGEIRVELYTDRRLGELTKSIYVYSNDPLHKRIRLVLMGNVIEK